jgi:phosphoribosylaminoimidazolecarboxamide formyltransferase/IMP cyclohydrolase
MILTLDREAELRYGENPHQTAALYGERGKDAWWMAATQLQGKEMSFNNYLDAEAAWRLANDFSEPTAVIVKHANPCGVASRATMRAAFSAAWDCDPVSAFGGVIGLNGKVDEPTARLIVENFAEVVVALSISDGAAEILRRKKNLRVLIAPTLRGDDLDMRRIENGFVAQRRDQVVKVKPGRLPDAWESVGERPLSTDVLIDLRFAWIVAAHAKSNAIVIAKNRTAVGIGAGDQSRVGAARRALAQAGDRAHGAVVASDGFFPFRDGVDTLGGAGVVAIVEPGGSMRDDEVVAAANEHGMAIVFTNTRHFRH